MLLRLMALKRVASPFYPDRIVEWVEGEDIEGPILARAL